MIKRISAKCSRYVKGNDRTTRHKEPLMYGSKGEELEVLRWVRWPSYDFIFAVPAKTSRFYKSERGFFQYRDTRKTHKPMAFMLDLCELREAVAGFTAMLKHAERRVSDEKR